MNQQTFNERFRKAIAPTISPRAAQAFHRQTLQNEGLPLFGSGAPGNFVGGLGSQFFGGLGDVATFVGADTPANFLYDISDKIEERLPEAKPAEWSWDYISSPSGLARGSGNVAGSIASILLPTLAMPESAPATIGRGLAAIPRFGKLFSTANPAMTGRFFTSGVPEAAMEAGNYYRNAVSQGMNPQEAWNNRWGVFGRNAAFLPLSNAVQYGLFTKLLGGRPLLSATGEVLSQGVEEFEQEAFQNQALNKPYTYNPIEAATNPDKYKEQIDAFNAGVLDFLPFTALGYAGGRARNWLFPEKTENADTRQETPPQETTNTPPDNPSETPPTNGNGDNGIDKFMRAIGGQESGDNYDAVNYDAGEMRGKYQIDVDNWSQWAQDAGLPADAPMTPENQERVARNKMQEYYNKFGNWRDVAIAWYGGERAVGYSEEAKNKPQYSNGNEYPSINEYADSVMERFNNLGGSESNEEDEDIYVGENGKGEGTYWVRNEGASLDGAQPDLLNAIDMLGKYFYDKTGKQLVVTAGTNGDHPSNGSEHGHDAGWKVDIADAGANGVGINEDGALFTANFEAQPFLKDFIAYGRSLGLGMNLEGEGTSNVHIDVALDGTQWDGNGENAGGFNPKKGRSRKGTSNTNATGATVDDEDSDIQPAKPVTFDDIIKSILQDNNNAQFNINSDDEGTLQTISDFAKGKRDTATGEAAMKLQEMFDTDGNFIQSHKNLKTLNEIFGDELKEFGQGKFNRRWSDLLQKSMQPGFIENLTDDDRKLFGNILKQKLKDAGIDLKGMPAVKQGLEKGDEKTFINAWQALQDRLNKAKEAEDAEPIISDKTQKALDDIHARINELTTSPEENAPQIDANSKLYREINKLNGEINKLTADREKLSQTKGNQAAQVDAAGKIAKIDADIRKKQAELDAKIDSFYNPPQPAQPVKVEPSERFAPIKAQADNAIENLNQQIEMLRAQGLDDNSPEIVQLTDKLMDIQTRVDELATLDNEVGTAVKERNSAAKKKDGKAYSKAKSQVASKSKQYSKKETELDAILNPQEEPAPVEVEPSKFFTQAKTQADNAIENLNQQIETLKSQGVAEDSPEIEQLTDKKYAIQAAVDELAKYDADAETAKKKKTDANKINDTKAYNTAEGQRKKAVDRFKNTKNKLQNLLNSQEEPAPVQEEPVELATEFADELNAIQQRKKELRDSGASAKDITALNQRRDKIKKDGTEIAKLKKQVEDLDNQIQAETDPQKRETLEDKRDGLQAQIEDKSQKLSNFINPPPKPQKETKKTYASVDDRVVDELSRLNRQILDAPDTEMPEVGKGDTPTASATKRREELLKRNNAVGQAQDDVLEKGKALQEARANGDEQAIVAAKSAFETAKENLAQKKKELDDFFNQPVKKETQPAPKPEHYEPTGEAKAEIDRLNDEIYALRNEDERKNSAEISAKAKRREAIQNQVDKIAKLEEQRDKKVAERVQAEADGKKQTANRLTSEIADKNEKIKAERTKLNDLVHPRNEDEKPAETKSKEQKPEQSKPKKYQPVDTETKNAIAKLRRDIKKLNEQISDVETDFLTGKSNGEKLKELQNSLADKKSLLKQIQAQSDKCSELKDKAATALRIMNDTDKPQAERDKASDALSNYGAQLREELQKLHDLIPPEPVKAPKEKTPSKKASKEKDTSKPQATPADESQSTPETPATDVQSESQPQESATKSEAALEQSETNAQPEENSTYEDNSAKENAQVQDASDTNHSQKIHLPFERLSKMWKKSFAPTERKQLIARLKQEIKDLKKILKSTNYINAEIDEEIDAIQKQEERISTQISLKQALLDMINSGEKSPYDYMDDEKSPILRLGDEYGIVVNYVDKQGVLRPNLSSWAKKLGGKFNYVTQNGKDTPVFVFKNFADAKKFMNAQKYCRFIEFLGLDKITLPQSADKLRVHRESNNDPNQNFFQTTIEADDEVIQALYMPDLISFFDGEWAGVRHNRPKDFYLYGMNNNLHFYSLIDTLIAVSDKVSENNSRPEEFKNKQPSTPSQPKKSAEAKAESPKEKQPQQEVTESEEQESQQEEATSEQAEQQETETNTNTGANQIEWSGSSLEVGQQNLKDAFSDFDFSTLDEPEQTTSENNKRQIAEDKFINVVDDSDEAQEKDFAELRKELSKLSANPIFNPKIWTLGLRIGIRYIQRGINNFAAWAKKMTEDVGKESEPWQAPIWAMLESMPQINKFNDKQLWALADRIGGLYGNGTTNLYEVAKAIEGDLGAENTAKLFPMIQATHRGIEKYFADLIKSEAKPEPKTPLEKAAQKINDLIEQWNNNSYAAWRKIFPKLNTTPASQAQELSDMVLAGVVEPDKAVEAANKLLNGTEAEQNQARKTYHAARKKLQDKRVAEFNPQEAKERLNKIAEKFPVLKREVEREIKQIDKGDVPINDKLSLTGRNDDEVEQWATYNLIDEWEKPYQSELNAAAISGNSDSAVAKIYNKANEILNRAEAGEILTQGIYKQVEKLLNSPQKETQGQPDTNKNTGILGNTAEVITGSRTPHQIRYKVVEASDLNSSHTIDNGGVFANENYPAELQPRDRTRANMQAELISMANNLNPADLLNARDVNQGAPVTRQDGVVLNGNGRTAAIRYAYENGTTHGYKETLIENAEKFGLNADEISKMNQPVLVRELTHDLTDEEMRDITNTQTGGVQMGASEQAQVDAAKLSQATLNQFPQGDNIDLANAEATDFLLAALNDIATPDEINSLTTADGKISQDGINRVKRALFAKAYGDSGLIARMSESTDDNVRGVTNALLNAAPTIAKVKAAMENGTLHNYDLSAITDAVNKLSTLRDEGKPVSKYLQEQGLFAEHADSEEMKEILSFLDSNKRAPKKIAAFLKKIANRIQNQGDPREDNLFGSNEPAPLIELIRSARREIENNGQQDLFAQSENFSQEKVSESKKQNNEPSQKESTDTIEQRAREALKAAGLEDSGAFESRGFSVEIEQLGNGTINPDKAYSRISINIGKDNGLTNRDIDAYKKIAGFFNSRPEDNISYVRYICEEKNAPALKRAFELYMENGIDNRIANAFENLKSKNNFTDEQLAWLEDIERFTYGHKGYGETGIKEFDKDYSLRNGGSVNFKTKGGGSEGLNKIFDGRLEEIVDELNDNIYKKQEATENVTDDSTRTVAERTGTRNNQDTVGRDDESREPRRGSVSEGVQEAGEGTWAQDSVRVQNGGTALGGEVGNRGVQTEESTDNSNRAGSVELPAGVRNNLAGDGQLDDGRKADDIGTAQDGRIDETNQQVTEPKEKVPYAAGDLESIKSDLPQLLPEQQEDVAFMEERLLNQGGTGVLLANGTGTGKTFSALGLIKRLFNSGKKNILIVTPSEDVNRHWQTEAKKFFGLDIQQLENTKDNGAENTICVTTYANFQSNKELALKNWDAIIADESHNLMQNKDGEATGYLEMFRSLTLNPREWYNRWKLMNRTKEIRKLEDELAKLNEKLRAAEKANKEFEQDNIRKQISEIEKKIADAYFKMNDQWKVMKTELETMNPADRPKAVFLSATPFAYDKCVDYAEGYLFNYSKPKTSGYNVGGGFEKFMIENFGYRMRFNKLTRPSANVDNRVMEVQFHDRLVNSGVMRGRQIEIDADYDRGFLLVESGIGQQIDDGFAWLQGQHDKYADLYGVLYKQLDYHSRRYLLESIKARAAIPIVKKYLTQGKKVVLFHQSMKEKANVEPFKLTPETLEKLRKLASDSSGVAYYNKIVAQWNLLKKERPDLVNLNLRNLPSPMESFRKGFGDKALYINGSAEHKKGRKDAQTLFNDDNSGKNLIIVQQDAGNAGISLHDTTGKHQRVLINVAMPERPSYAMQIEGRIYRVGNKSNAIIRYLATGTNLERQLFASTIGGRAATVENLALGEAARGLRESFKRLFMETLSDAWERRNPGHRQEGTGGKEMDSADKLNLTDWERAISYYFGQQKKSAKTKAAEGKDYFATPEPIGLKMVEWLGLQDGERVLEPSAGHGAISRWFSPNTQNTIVEPSGHLSPLAQIVTPDAKVIRGTFEDFNIVNKFEGIVMNPPFGTGGKTAIEHLAKAYKHLADGGRLIAIVPEGSQCEKRFDKWFYGDEAEDAVLTATIRLPTVTFGQAGTSVATKILIIDKLSNNGGRAKTSGHEINFSGVKNINELFDRMKNLTIPERQQINKNPFADVEKDFPEVTTKEAKNGATVYYIDGQRVSREKAVNESGRQADIKAGILANEFREKFGIEENKYSNARVSFYFDSNTGVEYVTTRFNLLEDAIRYARWLNKNYANEISKKAYCTKIEVIAFRNKQTFEIDTETGHEKINTSEAKEIVAKLDAENSTQPEAQSEPEPVQPTESANDAESEAEQDEETAAEELPRATEDHIPYKQWQANKALLKTAIENADINEDDKEFFSFLLKLIDYTETYHQGDNSWRNGENVNRIGAIQVNVEKLTGITKENGETLRSYLRGLSTNHPDKADYTGTHDLDKFSTSPYGLSQIVETQIKNLRNYDYRAMKNSKISDTSKQYLDLYANEAREEAEKNARQRELENSPEYKLKELNEKLERTNELLESYRTNLEKWQSKPDSEEKARMVRFFERQLEIDGKRKEHIEKQIADLQGNESGQRQSKADDKAKEPARPEFTKETFEFETGEFTHSKTGEKIPQAKLKDRVEREEYLRLNNLAKKHGGHYSKFSKSFLFKSAEERDAFVNEAAGTEKSTGKAETVQPQAPQAETQPQANNETPTSTANVSADSAEHKAWQKNWSEYSRAKNPDRYSERKNVLKDFCYFNTSVGEGRELETFLQILWSEDSDSGRVIKTKDTKAPYIVDFYITTNSFGKLQETFVKQLKDLAKSTGVLFDKNYFYFDNYKDATQFATTIKSELQNFANENAKTLNSALAQEEKAIAERKAPPPKWSAPYRSPTGTGNLSARASERLKILDSGYIELTYADNKQYPVVSFYGLEISSSESVFIALDAEKFDGTPEYYTTKDYRDPNFIPTQYRFEDYDSAKKFAEAAYKQLYALQMVEKQKAEEQDNTPLTDAQINEVAKNPDTANALEQQPQSEPPKVPQKIEDVKDFDELEKYLKDKHNMKLVPAIKKFSFKAVQELISGVEDVLTLFQRFSSRIPWVKIDRRIQVFASMSPGALSRQIALNVNPENFDKNGYEEQKKSEFPNYYREAGRHETGHFLDNLIEVSMGVVNPRYKEHSKDFVNWAYELLKQNGETRSLAEMKANISDYATKNSQETIAEAVKHYFTYGEKAAPLAKAIVDCLKRAATTDEWFNREILGIQPATKRLHEFAGRLTSGAVLKWYEHHKDKGTTDTKMLQGYAAALLYDDGLRNTLENLRKKGLSSQLWEKTLKAHVPDEKIMASSDEWTDARINEAAKITYVENAFNQLGVEIKNGKVTFPDEETKKLCIDHLKNIENPDFNLSLNGSGDTTISNFVDPKDLTEQQKIHQRLGADMGVRVVFFYNENGDFHGAHAGNISYINVNSKIPIGQVFWHESSHWIKSANPELWEKLRNAAGITDAQRKAYLKETGRTDLTTDEQIDEEIISDYFEDALKREGFFSKIGRKDPSLIQRVIAWLQDAMGKFFEYFNNPKGKLTNAQKQRMAHELGHVAKNLVNQNGEKIFRYNNRTHAIELVNGEKLENIDKISKPVGKTYRTTETAAEQLEDTDAYAQHVQNMERGEFKYSFAGEKAKTASTSKLAAARLMEQRGLTPDEIYETTGWFKGKDNKWRFEIPDNFNKINFDRLNRDGQSTLGEIYDNPKLYEAYPFLRNTFVEVDNLKDAYGETRSGYYKADNAADTENKKTSTLKPFEDNSLTAYYSTSRFEKWLNDTPINEAVSSIALDKKHLIRQPIEAKSTLVHEIQHVIQQYENFARGASPKEVGGFKNYYRVAGEQESREVERRAEASERLEATKQSKRNLKTAERKYNNIQSKSAPAKQKQLDKYFIARYENPWGDIDEKLTAGLPKEAIQAVDELIEAQDDYAYWADNTSEFQGVPQIHPENAIILYYGQEYSVASAAPPKTSTTEKLKAKIDNFLWSVKNERPRNHMRKLLEKLSGYQIRSGHVAEGIDILVKDISKVIRTPNAYEWKKILPEVGKLVAKRLNLNPTTEQGNYIASWLMDGAPNDTSQAAKDFQRAMRETDDMYRDQLLEVQSIFSEWNNRPPEQIAKDVIAHGNETKPLIDRAGGKLAEGYQQFVEELYPVKQLVDQYEKDNAKKLAAGENPYTFLRLLRGLAGRGKIMIEGDEVTVGVLKRLFPSVNFNNFKTLNTILKSCDALDNEENQREFSAYLLACAVKDLHKLNAANLRQQAELRDKIDTLEDELDTLTDKKKIKETEKRIEKLQEELKTLKKNIYATPFDEYETTYDNKVCDGTIAKYKDKYEQAQKDIINYQRTLLDMMVDSGLLSKEQKIGYMKTYPNHIPLFRKFDENEDKNFGDSLKAMKGSTRDVIDPIASLTKNTYDFVRRAEKNKAKILLANLARTGALGTVVEVDERTPLDEVDNKKPDVNTTITFFEGGQKKYLDTDPAVVKAVNNLSIPQMSWITKFLRVGTILLRNFATVFNPPFAFRNLIMDNQNAWLYNKYGMWSPADFVRGFLSVWNRDADYNEWMAMGGAQASFWSVDRDYTQASLDRLRKGRWGQYKSKPWQLLAVLGEWSELGTRVGYYKKVKKALAEKNGGKIDTNILIEAALESRDLTDFARGGKASRTWNNAVAFANASIQGWDKFFRTYDPRQYWSKDPEVKKQWERAMIRLALGSIAPTVLCFLINTSGDDDDWYEKDLPDWERQTHWIFGEDIRVPKGQDVGLRFFSNLTESMLRYMAKNDPKAFENWWKPAWEALPDFTPTALQPIIECATNYDMFRKNAIVPARQQRLPEYMQYDNRTSALAKGIGDSSLAKFIAGETGISPAKVDHFIYGYTGKLGQDFIRLGQNVLGVLPIIGKDEWVNYERFSDLPIISGIKSGFLRVPYRNPRILTEYYETLDEQTKLHNEFKLTKKRPEGYNHSLYTKLKKAQEQMRELTKKERKVLDDTHLDGDERDNRQLAIQKKRVALAERVLR